MIYIKEIDGLEIILILVGNCILNGFVSIVAIINVVKISMEITLTVLIIILLKQAIHLNNNDLRILVIENLSNH